jgi:hypothetical protein
MSPKRIFEFAGGQAAGSGDRTVRFVKHEKSEETYTSTYNVLGVGTKGFVRKKGSRTIDILHHVSIRTIKQKGTSRYKEFGRCGGRRDLTL